MTGAPPTQASPSTRSWLIAFELLFCALFCASSPAFSQEKATLSEATNPTCSPQQAQQHTIAQLLEQVEACKTSPDWLAHLGHQLNTQGRYTEAAEHLERALLLDPQHQPAAFAYSIALAGSSDIGSALNLLAQLTQRPDIPAPLRQELLSTQLQLASGQSLTHASTNTQQWVTQQSLALRLGYDNNLLGSPRLGSLTLTLPTGDVTLPLDATSLPQARHYQRADWRLDTTRTLPNGRQWTLSAALQHRNTPGVQAANASQAEAQIETQPHPTLPNGPWGNLNTSHLHTEGGTRYQATTATAGWVFNSTTGTASTTQWRLGTEWQQRNLASNPLLSGTYRGLNVQWSSQPRPGTQWQLHTRLGTDHASNPARPGGNQHLLALRATARWPNWLAEAEWQRSLDTTGYSPLLDNNRTRHLTRNLLQLERQFQLPSWGTGLQAATGVELYQQQSSLQLFKTDSANVYVSLRKQW